MTGASTGVKPALRRTAYEEKTMASEGSIRAFLAHPALAVVGMSRTGRKFGNCACRELTKKGYRIHPIHPSARAIDGVRCYERFTDLPEPLEAVLVVVPPRQAVAVMRDAAAAGIHHVWLQQGAESPEALAAGRALGLDVVAGECILMFARPAGIHHLHRLVRRVVDRCAARQ